MAKVGDYVKIIKKLPYKDQMGVEIGDIGVINYITSTTKKYSVHIDGKKNIHDDDPSQNARLYGKKYDFWIPVECCHVVDSEEVTKQLLSSKVFDNNYNITINDGNIDVKVGDITVETLYCDTCIPTIKASDIYFYDKVDGCCYITNKESEENKMKEIKNQKVVDLYFERKKKALEKAHLEDVKAAEKIDPNRVFVEELKKQFDDYVDANVDKGKITHFSIDLPLSEGCAETIAELKRQYNDNIKQLDADKEEIIAMLSGCETYEQELVVLKNYYIVNDNNTLMPA